MNTKKKYIVTKCVTLITFFSITSVVYLIALNLGNEGISLNLFGGGDDGYFYWDQIKRVINNQPWIYTSIYPFVVGNILKLSVFKTVYSVRIVNYIVFVFYLNVSKKIIEYQLLERNVLNNNEKYYSLIIFMLLNLFYLSMHMQVSLSIYRDVWIYFLYAFSLLQIIKIKYSFGLRKVCYIVKSVLLLFILSKFRPYAALSFVVSIVIDNLTSFDLYQRNKKIIIFGFVLFIAIYFEKILDITVLNYSIRKAMNFRRNAMTNVLGGSNMLIELEQNNFFVFLVQYILSFTGNVFGPLPWHLNSFSMILVFFLESIPMILILYIIFRHYDFLSYIQRYLLLHSLVWFSIIAFINDNIGTATRLRPVGWLLIFIVYSVLKGRLKYEDKENKT